MTRLLNYSCYFKCATVNFITQLSGYWLSDAVSFNRRCLDFKPKHFNLTCWGLRALMSVPSSVFFPAPTHCVLWTLKTFVWNTSLWAFAGCRVGFVQWSLYIHLLSLLPWQRKEELCLQNLHCSHFPVLPSRLMVAMETSRMSMTALCVRHAGRGDVMCFSPSLWLSLCCVRGSQLQHHWSARLA